MTANVQGPRWSDALLAACGGFLVATVWFDLMFDVQVLGHPPVPAGLPEATVASIAGYYRRVTTEAHPMQRLVGLVMAVSVLGSTWHLRTVSQRVLRVLAFVTSTLPIGLAATRVLPNAQRLGARVDTLGQQSDLARAIFVDHVFCWVAITAFTAIQIVVAARRAPTDP